MLVLGTREKIEIDIRFFNKNLAIMIKFLGSWINKCEDHWIIWLVYIVKYLDL